MEGVIRTTESNIGTPWMDPQYASGEHAGPPVVHLLNTPTPFDFDHGLTGTHFDKRAVRFEVSVRGVEWEAWEWTHLMSPRWHDMLVSQAGGAGASDQWLVFPAPVRAKRWVSVSVLESADVPDSYARYLGASDEYGYRPVDSFLLEQLAQVLE